MDDRVVLGPVEAVAPERGEDEREQEAHRVQAAPCAGPGKREDRAVQHREIAEQLNGLAALRDQHRREESAGDRERRQRLRIVAHGEPHARRGHQHEQRERGRLRQHAVQPERREHRQIENAGAGALERQPVPGRDRASHSPSAISASPHAATAARRNSIGNEKCSAK